MSQPDHDFDISSINDESGSEAENIKREIKSKLPQELKIAIGRFQGSVKKILNATNDVGLTQSIVKEALRNVGSGPRTIEKDRGENIMPGLEETKKESSQRSVKGEIVIDQLASLPVLHVNLEKANSESMNLLDSSAKRLHESLKRMLPESDPEAVRQPDIHTVQVACHVAHEITNLMRLKLDVMKFTKTCQVKE